MRKRLAKIEQAANTAIARRQRDRADRAKAEAWTIRTNPQRFNELMQRVEQAGRTSAVWDEFLKSVSDAELICYLDYHKTWIREQAALVDLDDLQRKIDAGTPVSELTSAELQAIVDSSPELENIDFDGFTDEELDHIIDTGKLPEGVEPCTDVSKK